MRAEEPATVLRPDLPQDRRVIVISDVHGNLSYLQGLLAQVEYRAGEDILILLGDLVERGIENLKTLHYVMALAKEPLVFVLCGNCDIYHQRWLLVENAEAAAKCSYWQLSRHLLLREMCEEIGIDKESTPFDEVKRRILSAFPEELAFLNALPTMLETEKYLFVHGGIPEKGLDYEKTKAIRFLKCDDFVGRGLTFDKTVVVGHWPVTLYRDLHDCSPYIREDLHIYSIDGGCTLKIDGQLNALILPNITAKAFTFTAFDAYPTRIAADDQHSSDTWNTTRWDTRQVKLLQSGGEFSLVERISDGAVLEVPNTYIWEYHGELCTEDYTDYRLEVRAGDPLKIIFASSKGYYCKKNGLIGWYQGALL